MAEVKPAAPQQTAATQSDVVELENRVRQALREVYDPELGMSVIELGLIRKFDWQPDKVEVTMILTTPFCPYGPALIEQVRQKTQEVAQRIATVTMGLEMWEPSMMEDQAAANWGLYY
ncbi:MAG: iron-sulfur cluster assembly protein [Anaerolineae bacterium]|nr:iron-sulfur cluster assembly protein [Thermoflexales bacterium]MDW8406874.1 iron-sulfur cluster assembly protein [Anaerolineae bacterium]